MFDHYRLMLHKSWIASQNILQHMHIYSILHFALIYVYISIFDKKYIGYFNMNVICGRKNMKIFYTFNVET